MPKERRIGNTLIYNQLRRQLCRDAGILKQADALKVCAMHLMIYIEVDANRPLNRNRRCQLRFDLLFNSLHGCSDLNHLQIRFGAILQFELPLLE
jgi:hypothetical protein